jgi:hypothetical protein
MANLKQEVRASAADLQAVWERLSGRVGSTLLPNDCYIRWEDVASRHTSLLGTVPLFDIREKAREIVRSLVDKKRIESEKQRGQRPEYGPDKPSHNFSHDGIDMDYACARHLALVSFVSTSWSIYDRLANVCGRLAATEMVQRHQKQNPKLVENFLAKEKEKSDATPTQETKRNLHTRDDYGYQLLAFSTQYHLVAAYDWPARVVYTIRNWLVHEGQSIGSLRLFQGDRIEDALLLDGGAVLHIEKMCGMNLDSNGDPKRCCLRGPANPWKTGHNKDLLEVLERYHAEVDTMLAGLLKWSVDSFVGQVVAFSERDKGVLSAVTVNDKR